MLIFQYRWDSCMIGCSVNRCLISITNDMTYIVMFLTKGFFFKGIWFENEKLYKDQTHAP